MSPFAAQFKCYDFRGGGWGYRGTVVAPNPINLFITCITPWVNLRLATLFNLTREICLQVSLMYCTKTFIEHRLSTRDSNADVEC